MPTDCPNRVTLSEMDRRTLLRNAALLTIPTIGGCLGGRTGSGGGTITKTSSPTTTPTEIQTASPTPTPTERPASTETPTRTPERVGQRKFPEYDWEALKGTEAVFTSQVTLKNTQFHPLIAEVPQGGSISFTNKDSFGHTVTIPALDVDKRLSGGASTTVTFDRLDTFDYVCKLHPPSMLGRLIVVDKTPTLSPTPEGTSTPAPTPTPTTTGGGGGYY